MTKPKWAQRIRDACADAGTYYDWCEELIDTLADMLARRDTYRAIYKKSGSLPLVMHTNKAGQQNLEKNPALRMIDEINRDALPYWQNLGLTPAAWRKLNGKTAADKPPADPLAAALSNIRLVK